MAFGRHAIFTFCASIKLFPFAASFQTKSIRVQKVHAKASVNFMRVFIKFSVLRKDAHINTFFESIIKNVVIFVDLFCSEKKKNKKMRLKSQFSFDASCLQCDCIVNVVVYSRSIEQLK